MLFYKFLVTTNKSTTTGLLAALVFAVVVLTPGAVVHASTGNVDLEQSIKNSTPTAIAAADTFNLGEKAKGDTCGGKNNDIKTSIDFGCQGRGNAILDLMFAIIRFLSYGAGLAIVGSLIYAGIHYSAARGDPQAVGLAKSRIQNVIIALFLFIFIYAILNFLIPEQLLK